MTPLTPPPPDDASNLTRILVERRQIVTLEILAGIANKLEIDGRFSDFVRA